MNISYESKLKCFYLNTTLRPYLRLTRVRVEELYKRPQIVLIHNFLSETEAMATKTYAIPTLQKAQVVNADNKQVIDVNRISRLGGIPEHKKYKHFFDRINRRISEISGKY